MEMLNRIIVDGLNALYQPFWFSLLLAVLAMFVIKKYKSLSDAVKEWIFWFKSDYVFRRLFALVFYRKRFIVSTHAS